MTFKKYIHIWVTDNINLNWRFRESLLFTVELVDYNARRGLSRITMHFWGINKTTLDVIHVSATLIIGNSEKLK